MQRTHRRRDALRRRTDPRRPAWRGYGEPASRSTTIVRYTDREHARNEYPYRIISPSRSGPCCLGPMEVIGEVHADGSALFQYQRCPHCGFTVRRVLEQLPDAALVAELRLLLERSFMRNVAPELWAA